MRGCVSFGDWGSNVFKFQLPTATHSENQHHCRESGRARGKTTKGPEIHRLVQAILWFLAWLLLLKYRGSMQPAKHECLHRDAEPIANCSHAPTTDSLQLK